MDKLFIGLIGGFFGIFGLFLMRFAINATTQSVRACNWPTVPGEITCLSFDESTDSDSSTYHVIVRYRYTVLGQTYEGDRLAFGYPASNERPPHQAIFEKLKQASSVQVRYDPDNPQVSTLSCGIHRWLKSSIGFALAFITFAVSFPVFMWTGAQMASLVSVLCVIFALGITSQRDNVLLKNIKTWPGSGGYH